MRNRIVSAAYIRNFVFGVEDALVSSVGLMSGIALAGVSGKAILLTGIVYTFVEAFSMAAGSFLSERSGQEYMQQSAVSPVPAVIASGIMFISYAIAGVIPIAPYALFTQTTAFHISVAGSLLALLVLGAIGARFSKTPMLSRAIQMAVVGGVAILLGIAVGQLTGLAA